MADVLFSITPYEQELYEHIPAKHVVNHHFRVSQGKLGTHRPKETDPSGIFPARPMLSRTIAAPWNLL